MLQLAGLCTDSSLGAALPLHTAVLIEQVLCCSWQPEQPGVQLLLGPALHQLAVQCSSPARLEALSNIRCLLCPFTSSNLFLPAW